MNVLDKLCDYILTKSEINNVKIVSILPAKLNERFTLYIDMMIESDNELIDHYIYTLCTSKLEETEECLNCLKSTFDVWYSHRVKVI